MEFEKNTQATAEDIALADTPRLSLQPIHREISVDAVNSPGSRLNEPNFSFESESTIPTDNTVNRSELADTSHKVALISSIIIVVLFGAALATLLLCR